VLCNLLCLSIVDFLGLAALEWFFSSENFHFLNKYLVLLFSAFKIFCCTRTHTWYLEVNYLFFSLELDLLVFGSYFLIRGF
jgi:hypothetical protein